MTMVIPNGLNPELQNDFKKNATIPPNSSYLKFIVRLVSNLTNEFIFKARKQISTSKR